MTLDEFLDQNEIHQFEGERGVAGLTILVKEIGYDDIEDFLRDNPAAQEALVEFIRDVPQPWFDNPDTNTDPEEENL